MEYNVQQVISFCIRHLTMSTVKHLMVLKNSNGNSKPLFEKIKTGPKSGLVLELFLVVPGEQDF
jgi:hypothetical protein